MVTRSKGTAKAFATADRIMNQVWAAYQNGEYVCAGTPREMETMLHTKGLATRLDGSKTTAVRTGVFVVKLLVPATEPVEIDGSRLSTRDFDVCVASLISGRTLGEVASILSSSENRVRQSLVRIQSGRYPDLSFD